MLDAELFNRLNESEFTVPKTFQFTSKSIFQNQRKANKKSKTNVLFSIHIVECSQRFRHDPDSRTIPKDVQSYPETKQIMKKSCLSDIFV